jgi:hypothetical protein
MQQIEFIFLRLLLYMFRALHSPIIRSINCTSGYGVTINLLCCWAKCVPSVQLIWIWHTLRRATQTIYTVTPYPLVQLMLLMMGECSARNM